jgi:hypothetical protein
MQPHAEGNILRFCFLTLACKAVTLLLYAQYETEINSQPTCEKLRHLVTVVILPDIFISE